MASKGCAFLMDMGTGKTITTIALAGTLYHKHRITQMSADVSKRQTVNTVSL